MEKAAVINTFSGSTQASQQEVQPTTSQTKSGTTPKKPSVEPNPFSEAREAYFKATGKGGTQVASHGEEEVKQEASCQDSCDGATLSEDGQLGTVYYDEPCSADTQHSDGDEGEQTDSPQHSEEEDEWEEEAPQARELLHAVALCGGCRAKATEWLAAKEKATQDDVEEASGSTVVPASQRNSMLPPATSHTTSTTGRQQRVPQQGQCQMLVARQASQLRNGWRGYQPASTQGPTTQQGRYLSRLGTTLFGFGTRQSNSADSQPKQQPSR